MSPSFLIRCVIVVAMVRPGLCDAARVGQLEVKSGTGGAPCFTISEAEEMRGGAPDFQSITVSDAAGGAKAIMWNMAMPGQRTFPVSFRMCVPYAGRLPVLPQTPAAVLQPGRVYEVAIETRKPVGAGAARSYRARFCVAREGRGVMGVRSTGAEGRQRHVCGA